MSEFKFTEEERKDIRIDMNSHILTDGEIIDRIETIISARGESDGWVRVEDVKPKNGTLVLVFNGEHVFTGVFDDYYEGEPEWTDSQANEIKPTHWHPLPSPPKPESK